MVVAVLGFAAAASIAVGEPVWAVFAGGGIAIALLPAVVRRESSVMPPWEVLVFTAFPIASQFLDLSDALADLTTYLAILAVGTLVVELHVFSPVRMTPLFVVLTAMATAGVWAIVQYASDVYFGTVLVRNKTTLMWDLVFATALSLAASPLLAVYFRWIETADLRGLVPGDAP